MIDLLFHALEHSGIDFVLRRDEIENGLKRLGFRFESHGLDGGFRSATWLRGAGRERIELFRILIGVPCGFKSEERSIPANAKVQETSRR